MARRAEIVLVAMSGGVDSSVTACLLQEAGYEVIGITLSLKKPCADDDQALGWCGAGAEIAARQVALNRGFAHHVIDCAASFEHDVLKPAWDDYVHGRTPSPCVLCNQKIKFSTLLGLLPQFGAAKMATGHYARIGRDERTGRPTLLRAKDLSKDQSYFLFALDNAQLDASLLPLGELTKKEVRARARVLGLGNAERPDSQDACFASADLSFAESLRQHFNTPARSGLVVDEQGQALGQHLGIHHFTVGQRKGLGIALGKRAYVAQLDTECARVVLSDDPAKLESTGLTARAATWVGGAPPELPLACQVQIRSRHHSAPAILESEQQGVITLRFQEPQRAVTPGQAAVFYLGDKVLGGAWIDCGWRRQNG